MDFVIFLIVLGISGMTATGGISSEHTVSDNQRAYIPEENRGDFNRIKEGDGIDKIISRNGDPTEIVENGEETILKYKELGRAYAYIDGKKTLDYAGLDITFFLNSKKFENLPKGVYKMAVYNGDNKGMVTKDDVIASFGKPDFEKNEKIFYMKKEDKRYLLYFFHDEMGNVTEYGLTAIDAEDLK